MSHEKINRESNHTSGGKVGDIYLSGYDDDDSYEGVYSSIELVTGDGVVKDALISSRLTGKSDTSVAKAKKHDHAKVEIDRPDGASLTNDNGIDDLNYNPIE